MSQIERRGALPAGIRDLSGLLLRRVGLTRDDLRARIGICTDQAGIIANSMTAELGRLQKIQAADETIGMQPAGQGYEGSGHGRTRVDDGDRTRLGLQAASRPIGNVFISYVREDSIEVDRLQRVLETAGVRVWRDTMDLWPGEDWQAKIRHAITDDALVFLACFSHRRLARKKSYQNEELAIAIDQLRRRP